MADCTSIWEGLCPKRDRRDHRTLWSPNDLAVLFRDSFNWRKLVQAYWVVFGVKSECWNSDLLDIFFDADIVVQILLVFVAVHLDIDMLFNMAHARLV